MSPDVYSDQFPFSPCHAWHLWQIGRVIVKFQPVVQLPGTLQVCPESVGAEAISVLPLAALSYVDNILWKEDILAY